MLASPVETIANWGRKAFSNGGKEFMIEVMLKASHAKDIIADIINVAIEEMVAQRYELPAFSAFLRIAFDSRASVNKMFYQNIYNQLDESNKESLIICAGLCVEWKCII